MIQFQWLYRYTSSLSGWKANIPVFFQTKMLRVRLQLKVYPPWLWMNGYSEILLRIAVLTTTSSTETVREKLGPSFRSIEFYQATVIRGPLETGGRRSRRTGSINFCLKCVPWWPNYFKLSWFQMVWFSVMTSCFVESNRPGSFSLFARLICKQVERPASHIVSRSASVRVPWLMWPRVRGLKISRFLQTKNRRTPRM